MLILNYPDFVIFGIADIVVFTTHIALSVILFLRSNSIAELSLPVISVRSQRNGLMST